MKTQEVSAINPSAVYRVPKTKGTIDFVSLDEVIQDVELGDSFTKGTAIATLEEGKVLPSNDYYYAVNEDLLKEFEGVQEHTVEMEEGFELTNPPSPEETEVEAKPEVGDTVHDAEKGRYGTVFLADDGTKKVKFIHNNTEKSVKLTKVWAKAENVSLEMLGKVIEPEVIKPLTEMERAELAERESAVLEAKTQLENAPFTIGENLAEILDKNLYRETHANFGLYVQETFGFSREHAHRLAQISRYKQIADPNNEGAEYSIQTAIALASGTNKLSEKLGLGKVELQVMKPVIESTMRLLVDTAPKDKITKEPILTPAFVNSFNETLREHIEQGVVEIEGVQMPITEASEKGLLNAGLQASVVERVAEGIKANKQVIADYAKERYERMKAPATPKPASGTFEYYEGKSPLLGVKCSHHKTQENQTITLIGNATLQTACGCRWRIDSETGLLVCWEVEGKRVNLANGQVK